MVGMNDLRKRVGAWCIRNGFPIPTDEEFARLPERFKSVGDTEADRLAYGIDLDHYIRTKGNGGRL